MAEFNTAWLNKKEVDRKDQNNALTDDQIIKTITELLIIIKI